MANYLDVSLGLFGPCPSCGESWQAGEIPEDARHLFGNNTHFSRLIGLYSRDEDCTIGWMCPDCGAQWDRA